MLKIFPKENISFDEKPILELKEYYSVDRLIEFNSNKDIEEINFTYMDNIQKNSYLEPIIFINLFISQYNHLLSE